MSDLITSLKDLDKLMALCRKRGISAFEINGIKFHVDLTPSVSTTRTAKSAKALDNVSIFDPGSIAQPEKIEETASLTDEQLLFYSSDPALMNN